MPEVQHPPRASSQKARSVDDVGVAARDRLEQLRVLARVVLQVGVLDDDDVPLRIAEADRDRGALPLVRRLQEHPDAVPTVDLAENLARAVRRSVVDDQELFFDRDREDLRDDLADRVGLVVDGHHHRQLHGGCLLSPGSGREAATGSSNR